MAKILISGAAGFVGKALLATLSQNELYQPIGMVRAHSRSSHEGYAPLVVADIDANFCWPSSLTNVDCVIHCAGRAHVLNDGASDPLLEFRKVNLEGTVALARGAANAGVRRFVFLSSIGVNGSATYQDAFTESAQPAPAADYAVSKFEAEQALKSLQAETSMEIVIIRPPLVYAANAPGNFQRLLRLVSSRLPLPLAGVDNQRSMIALDNLVDFIVCCINHPAAANELFLISDGENLSTEEIVRNIASGMGFSKALLCPYPEALLRAAANLIGKQNLYSQLYGSLVVDASKARQLLGWRPKLVARDALQQAGQEYRQALPIAK